MLKSNVKSLLKNVLKSASFLILHSHFSRNLNICLKSINSSLNETLSILKYKNSKLIDKQHLYMLIKRNAHFVEKFILFPEGNKNKKFENLNYIKLRNGLKEWAKRGFKGTEPIKWASNILNQYEEYYPDGCPNCRIINKNNSIQSAIKPEDLLNLMKVRRSRRFFLKAPLSEKQKELLVEVAIHAPSSCNGQSIRIMFIENPKLKRFASTCITGGKIFFDNAQTLIIILADKREYRHPDGRYTPYQDAAAAIQNILLLAETLELACCWGSLTSYGDIVFEKGFRRKFNIPEFFLITGSIAIGHKTKETILVPRDQPNTRYSTDKFYWDNK